MKRVHDDFTFFGTERMFRRAGFSVVRGPLKGMPKNWVPRVTMRVSFNGRQRAEVARARRGFE